MRDHKKKKPDPSPSNGPRGLIEKKAVVSGSSSVMCGPSSSSPSLTLNRSNGSHKTYVSPVFNALLKQGDAIQKQSDQVDRALGICQDQSESIKAQVAMLTVQGSLLMQHSNALGQIMKDHQKLQGDLAHVQTEVGRQGSVLEQTKTKLEVIEGRMDKLWKGRRDNDNGNPKLRRSTRIEASRTPGARTSASGAKHEQVQCSFCQKTLSSSYIRHHIPRCPALRPPPRGSQ